MSARRRFISEFDVATADFGVAADYSFIAEGAGSRMTVIAVEPWGKVAWTGSFAAPDPGRRSLSALLGTPSPSGLCVVERGTAFLGDVLDPSGFETVSTDGPVVAAAELADEAVLLLITSRAITGVGARGVLWTTQRLAIDGLRVDEADGGWARGVADPDDDEPRDFAVELSTGDVIGGAAVA